MTDECVKLISRFSSAMQLCRTSSSAVAERPRDASCLSVISFNSTTRRAQSSIIGYFGFRFTAGYN